MNLSRILCPVDFSETSERALAYALELAAADSLVEVLHVLQPLPGYMWPEGLVGTPDEYVTQIRQEADKNLAALVERHHHPTVTIVSSVREGRADTTICEAAEDADLIVMGTHGRSAIERLLVGSVTERVVRHATKPVLVVP